MTYRLRVPKGVGKEIRVVIGSESNGRFVVPFQAYLRSWSCGFDRLLVVAMHICTWEQNLTRSNISDCTIWTPSWLGNSKVGNSQVSSLEFDSSSSSTQCFPP
jgi:hypothetical protein